MGMTGNQVTQDFRRTSGIEGDTKKLLEDVAGEIVYVENVNLHWTLLFIYTLKTITEQLFYVYITILFLLIVNNSILYMRHIICNVIRKLYCPVNSGVWL